MVSMTTKESILHETTYILAREGVAGTSMRKVAAAVGIEASVIYSHFPSKRALMKATREHIAHNLAIQMAEVTSDGSASDRLRSMLRYQMKSRDIIIAMLQYFMVIREDFVQHIDGYMPHRAYQHFHEIIAQGVAEGVFYSDDIDFDAKAINHLVGGFLMEYFDQSMSGEQLESVVEKLHGLITRTLTVKNGAYA